jgi:maltose alpha-D-glucosyltransferase/alpha-amylase
MRNASPPEELPLLVLFDGWRSFFRDRVMPWRISLSEKVREQLETEALPRFVAGQRWYAAKAEPVRRVAILDHAEWKTEQATWLVALFSIEGATAGATYFVPLALAFEDGDEERLRTMQPVSVARVRQQARVGILGDAFADEGFCRASCRRWVPTHNCLAHKAAYSSRPRLLSLRSSVRTSPHCRHVRPRARPATPLWRSASACFSKPIGGCSRASIRRSRLAAF